tara:strand:- start:510 stop:1613 length:1104 start_codon:yes stop_codon:yes gene_type:complete
MTVRITKPEFNLREKLTELDKPSGVKGNELLKSETTQEARDLIGAGRKNYIINGDFQISQRGDYTSATTVSNQAYYLDRWTVDVAGVGATIQQKVNQSVGNSSGNYYKNTVKMEATSSATGYLQLRQKMELHKSLFGKTVTVSAWVKSNHSNVRLRTEGGHVSGNWDSLQSHSGNGQWEKLSMTIALKSNPSHLVFGILIWGSTGGPSANHAQGAISSGDYYEFTDYQVEIGENATDFEHRTIGEELALCHRYFHRFAGAVGGGGAYGSAGDGAVATLANWTNTSAYGPILMGTTMRYAPTLTGYANVNYFSAGNTFAPSGSQMYLAGSSRNRVEITLQNMTGMSQGNAGWLRIDATAGYMDFDAEL